MSFGYQVLGFGAFPNRTVIGRNDQQHEFVSNVKIRL